MLYQKILANLIIALWVKLVTRDFWVRLVQRLANANVETGHHALKTLLLQLVMRKTIDAFVAQLEAHLKVVQRMMKFALMESVCVEKAKRAKTTLKMSIVIWKTTNAHQVSKYCTNRMHC